MIPVLTIRNVARSLAFLTIILLSGCAYLTTGETSITLICICVCVVSLAGLVDWNEVRVAAPDNTFILMILIGMLFSQILYPSHNSIVETGILFLRIVAAYMVTKAFTPMEFAKLYIRTIGITTIFAVLVWTFRNFGMDVPGIRFTNINGTQYKTIFVCSWMLNSNRLMGIFWEPGLYASSAIIAIILAKKYLIGAEQIVSYVILIIGILLSQSTAGYILLALSLYFIIFQRKKHKSIIDYIVLFVCIYLFFNYEHIVQTLLSLNPDIFWKLEGSNLTTDTRLNSPLACLNIFKMNPITGAGLRYATDLFSSLKNQYHMDALTSTSFFYLAAYGIWGLSYSALNCLAVFRRKSISFPMKIILIAITFLILNKEPHYSIAITYVFLFYFSRTDTSLQGGDLNASFTVN